MFKAISNFWIENTIGDKLYLVMAIVACGLIVYYLYFKATNSPKRKIKFVEDAAKANRVVVAKMTCLILRGRDKAEYYDAEYMYIVDGVRYFINYQMSCHIAIDGNYEDMNADMLLLHLKPALFIFYSEKNPQKAISKLEIFTSRRYLHQTRPWKNNAWRDTEKIWTDPIDLIQYTR